MRHTALHRMLGVAAGSLMLAVPLASAVPTVASAGAASPGVADCRDGSAARVAEGSHAAEPELYPKNEAKKYGVIKDSPYLGNGTVTVRTVFHVITDGASQADRDRLASMVHAQMDVLNASSGGSYMTSNHFPRFVLSGSYESGFTSALMRKDLKVAVELAHDLGEPVLFGARALEMYNAFLAQGDVRPDTDNMRVVQFVAELMGDERTQVRA